jgi:HK97 gp10 family phage protein
MARAYVDFSALEEYMLQLNELGADLDAAAPEILQAGAEVALAGMQRRVPKDTHNLEEHLVQGPAQQDGNVHFMEVGLVEADADTARYGTVQEYGSASVEAQSYIRATIAEDKGKIRSAMRSKAKEIIGRLQG